MLKGPLSARLGEGRDTFIFVEVEMPPGDICGCHTGMGAAAIWWVKDSDASHQASQQWPGLCFSLAQVESLGLRGLSFMRALVHQAATFSHEGSYSMMAEPASYKSGDLFLL